MCGIISLTDMETMAKVVSVGSMSSSGLRFLMGSSGSTGETWVWPLIAHFFYLDMLSNS
ncbi:hypothetical protein SESBI_30144 [Sesbania bispinosa]|nr:hypothetical protein SESBI_30144 [Sesbania bispinosa]